MSSKQKHNKSLPLAKPCLVSFFRCFGQAGAEQGILVIVKLQNGTKPYWLIIHQSFTVCKFSSPWQQVEIGSCADVTLCFELLFPHVNVSHRVLFFSEDKGCFTADVHACEQCTGRLKSVWRQPGSLWLVPWSRQCQWDYSYLHNSGALPAITIWHLHPGLAFNSQSGSFRELPTQSLMSPSLKKYGVSG